MVEKSTCPILSIITICFRNPDDLERTLTTIADLPANVECLIIDGSPDDSCAAIARRFPWARHLQQHDDGKYDAMNHGIAAARGDGLLFLNSGDELASRTALVQLLDEHAGSLVTDIVYADCKHRSGGQDILVVAPTPYGENLRLGRLPSHQSTIIPRRYHVEHLYDATMFFAADTYFLKRAYRDLPSRHFAQVIGVFSHGGASTSPGKIAMLLKQYRELSLVHELSTRERRATALLLMRRKLLHLMIGEDRLQRLQAWRLMHRHRQSVRPLID
jgi:glycosyltransferase involved in cell wall biosynthesis